MTSLICLHCKMEIKSLLLDRSAALAAVVTHLGNHIQQFHFKEVSDSGQALSRALGALSVAGLVCRHAVVEEGSYMEEALTELREKVLEVLGLVRSSDSEGKEEID